MQVIDHSGTTVKLDLTPCEFGHLLNEMVALAHGVMKANGPCPQSGRHDPTTSGDGDVALVSPGTIRPDPRYAAVPLESFVGEHVKIAFQSARVEHMWVLVTHVENDNLVGTLANEPAWVCDVKYGDRVVLDRAQIEDIQGDSHEGTL
jgi:hypothetical protein